MANNLTIYLENGFKSLATNLNWLKHEADDIYTAYFATGVNVLVDGLAESTTAASLETKYTKAQYQNAIGFIEQVNKFFSGDEVSTGDYRNTIENCLFGAAATGDELSEATEALADRIKILASSALTQFMMAQDLLALFYNSELGAVIANVTGPRIVWGSNMNVTQMTQGITLVEQWKKMINNEAVAQSMYATNVAVWLSL